ncbi:hypothetical protein K8R78_04775 [bacterium]|nr:hypothetical protein [bacterium]
MRKVTGLLLLSLSTLMAQPPPDFTIGSDLPDLFRFIFIIGIIAAFFLISWLILKKLVKLRNESAEGKARQRAILLTSELLLTGKPPVYEVVEELIDSCRREYSVPLSRLTVADLLEDVQAAVLMDALLTPETKESYLTLLRERLDEAQQLDAQPKKKRTVKGEFKASFGRLERSLKEENLDEAKAELPKLKKSIMEIYRFGVAFNPLYDALTLARKHPKVAFFGGLIYFGLFLFALLTVWNG